MSERKLRVGIIGAGGISRGAHIPGYLHVQDRAEIVAVADVDPRRAEEVAREYHIPHAYTDYRRMLAEVPLDAVSVCTPNAFHKDATVAALEAGAHVLCEKPMAVSAAEAEEMVAAARRTGRILMIGFHQRFRPAAQAAKRFVDGGEVGRVYLARARALRRRRVPGWGAFHKKDLSGGGPLIDIGVHALDLTLWLMGFPEPVEVAGATYAELATRPGMINMWGDYHPEEYTVEDAAVGFVRFANGASLLLETSWALNISEDEIFWSNVLGTEGGVEVFPLRLSRQLHDTLVDVTPAWLPPDHGHRDEVAHFVDACLGRVAPLVQPEEGLLVQRILDGLYRSAAEGRAVTL